MGICYYIVIIYKVAKQTTIMINDQNIDCILLIVKWSNFFQNFAKYKVQAISKAQKIFKNTWKSEKFKTQPDLQKYSVQGFFKKN